MPAPNLAQYKKLRQSFREIKYDYENATSNLDTKTYGFGIGDLEEASIIFESLENLEPRVSELLIRISATLDTNDLKDDAKSDFKEMLNALSNYKSKIQTFVREIQQLI